VKNFSYDHLVEQVKCPLQHCFRLHAVHSNLPQLVFVIYYDS